MSRVHCSFMMVAMLLMKCFVPIPLILWNIILQMFGGFMSGIVCPFHWVFVSGCKWSVCCGRSGYMGAMVTGVLVFKPGLSAV